LIPVLDAFKVKGWPQNRILALSFFLSDCLMANSFQLPLSNTSISFDLCPLRYWKFHANSEPPFDVSEKKML